MGGVNLEIAQPQGYVEASSAMRQAANQLLSPPENIFALYVPAADKAARQESGLKIFHNKKFMLVSARPEFNREIIDQPFYRAMQRDIARVNGNFSAERLVQFKVLTESYYARNDAFSHSLGVYDSSRASISTVRLVRLADSRGAGAVSAYPPAAPTVDNGAGEGIAAGDAAAAPSAPSALGGWAKTYFSSAYHQVAIQNVIFLNGRCFNIYFFAPLEDEDDIYAAMRENKNYIAALTDNIAQLRRAPGGFGAGGQNSADAAAPPARAVQ